MPPGGHDYHALTADRWSDFSGQTGGQDITGLRCGGAAPTSDRRTLCSHGLRARAIIAGDVSLQVSLSYSTVTTTDAQHAARTR